MVALYAVAFLSSLGFSVVIPFMVLLVMRFGGNGFVLGAIGALFWAAQLVGSAWLGSLSDRIGRKRVLLRSQFGAIAAWLIFLCALSAPRRVLAHPGAEMTGAFVLTLPLLLIGIARVADGLFDGSISVANAYMADMAEGVAREVGYARLGAASSLGFVVGPVISGVVARTQTGVIVVVVLAMLFSVSAALLVRFGLPAVPPRPGTPMAVVREGGIRAHKPLGGGCPEAVRQPRWRVREVLAIPALRPMLALYFLVYLAFSIFTVALPAHAAADLGWSASGLGGLFATLAVALAATETLLLPRVARRVATPVIAAGGCALLIGAYLLMSLADSAALIGGALLYGVGNGLMWPSYLVMLSHAGPARLQGTVQGVGSSAGSLASIFGTLAGGVLFVTIGVATMYVSAAAIAIATGMFFGVTLRTPRIAPDLAQPVPERPPRVRPVRGTTSQAGSGATSRPGSRARTRAGSEDARARWHA